VWIDKFTARNLELVHSPNENAKTLTDIIDKTTTPMGARQLKRWIMLPLKEKSQIENRLNIVDYLMSNSDFSFSLKEQIRAIGDLERLISKVAVGKINPREVLHLKRSLRAIAEIKLLCKTTNSESFKKIGEQLNACQIICDKIEREIDEEAPVLVSKGNVICSGVNAELDELRSLSSSGKDYLMSIQQREVEATGIPSLKIGFNNVFGYYLEVTNTHKDKVPSTWVRK
jgi:DNA mismatch repair protein MutS